MDSGDYEDLLKLLGSTTYRRQFSNFFTGGASDAYSVTLNPRALIYFYRGDEERYELWQLGRDVPAGPSRNKYDYAPRGGEDFQR